MIRAVCINCKRESDPTTKCGSAGTDPLRMHVFGIFSRGTRCVCARNTRDPCVATPGFDKIGCKDCGHASVFCHMTPLAEWVKRYDRIRSVADAKWKREREDRTEQYRLDFTTGQFVKQPLQPREPFGGFK